MAVTGVGTWVAETGDPVLDTNTWTHIAYVRSDVSNQTLYVNGVAQALISDADYTFHIINENENSLAGAIMGPHNFTAGEEYIADTDPNDPEDYFHITAVLKETGGAEHRPTGGGGAEHRSAHT